MDKLEGIYTSIVSRVEVKALSGVQPSYLKKFWSISDKEANKVLKSNTQLNRQPIDSLLSRHFSTNNRVLCYERIESFFFSDTISVTKSAKSIKGNLHLQFFVSDKGFVAVYNIEKKFDFKDALHIFCKEVGVPIVLVVDPSGK